MSQYNVFTDGSKMNKKVGAGFQNKILLEKAVSLPNLASVFQAEITAISIATDFLLNEDCRFLKKNCGLTGRDISAKK